jgi:hypothetical protein
VYDWALLSGVITWILVACAGFALTTAVVFMKKPFKFSVQLGGSSDS